MVKQKKTTTTVWWTGRKWIPFLFASSTTPFTYIFYTHLLIYVFYTYIHWSLLYDSWFAKESPGPLFLHSARSSFWKTFLLT